MQRSRLGGTALLLTLLCLLMMLASCTGDTASPGAPTRPPSPQPGESASHGEAACTVRSFKGRNRITIINSRPRILYGYRRTVPAGARVDRPSVIAHQRQPVHLGLTLTRGSGPLPDDLKHSILATAGTPLTGDTLAATAKLSVHVRNPTEARRSYLAYLAANRVSGTWAASVCGHPFNDGSSVAHLRGYYVTVSRFHRDSLVCGVPDPRPSAFDARARALACP